MMKKIMTPLGHKKRLALCIPLFMAAQAQGIEFNLGDIEGSLNSQLSIGSSWRVEQQDPGLLGGINGASTNNDDSNNNYQDGDAFSQLFKGNHDLQFSYQNFGGLVRGKYWYDSALANNGVDYGHGPTTTIGGASGSAMAYNQNTTLDDSDFHDLAKASGVALLDAFIYGEFEVMDMPLDVRLGRQVVNWGESTFIDGGINAINPLDVSALRRPGAEIKEALLPVNMAYASVGLSDDLSAEMFYQLEFEGHAVPGCGTYFSLVDSLSEGCNNITVANGQMNVSRSQQDGHRLAKDDGQFGLAFRYVAQDLGNTEFGLYAMNIHNRVPSTSFIKNDVNELQIANGIVTAAVTQVAQAGQAAIANDIATGVYAQGSAQHQAAGAALQGQMAATQAAVTPQAVMAATAQVTADSHYYTVHEEDLQVLGLSFASNVGSMALAGEVSHKSDVPVQINGPYMVSALLGAHVLDNIQGNENPLDLQVAQAQEGAEIEGFRRFDITQLQVSATQFIDRILGASRMTLVGEAAITQVHDFDTSADAIKFGRGGLFGHPDDTEDDGFVTEYSWGYRALVNMEYNNVLAGLDLKPTLTWREDVKGYSPTSGAFKEGQQALGLALNADYQSLYNGSISYTRYSGGQYSQVSDRDFASISVGVQF